MVKICEKHGILPSVLAGEDTIEKALPEGTHFMMETVYIDDLKRPGSVLGPKTIPKRIK
jgi:TatD-related deoxyribonuclease